MRTFLVGLLAMSISSAALAVTVVLKDGRVLEAANTELRGNYLLVRYASGRVESYPMSVVDEEATRRANAVPAPAPTPGPSGPQSPFASALSSAGGASTSLRDEDLPRRAPPEDPDQEGSSPAEQEPAIPGAQVEVVGYDYVQVEEGVWDIRVTVTNRGRIGATAVQVAVRLLDPEGALLGSGQGRMDATLAPGAEGRIIARVESAEGPSQVALSLQWQTFEPVGAVQERREPVPTPGTPGAAEQAQPQAPRPGRPEGTSPMTVPDNPRALPSPVLHARPGQVPPPTPIPR